MSDASMHGPPLFDHESLTRTLNALFMGFQVIGVDWKYLFVNPAAAGHGRTSPRDLIGRTMFEAFPDIEHQEPLMSYLRSAMKDRTSHVFENQFTFPDGTTHWFHIRVEPVPEGICIYSVDINERKERELTLQRRVAELERRRLPFITRLWRSLTGSK
jgi:PAS domain S-box-containing protein